MVALQTGLPDRAPEFGKTRFRVRTGGAHLNSGANFKSLIAARLRPRDEVGHASCNPASHHFPSP
jgi:hypothetical protein